MSGSADEVASAPLASAAIRVADLLVRTAARSGRCQGCFLSARRPASPPNWGNILGHVNVEVLPAWVGRRVHSWTLHAITFHALHHARYVGHYVFGATFMHRWLASEWKDWPGLHSKVLAGEALTYFKQRG